MSRWKATSPGQRLDRFLAEALGRSRGYCQDLIRRGCVKVSGRTRSSDYRLEWDDEVALEKPAPEWPRADLDSWLIFEDKHCLALRKPSGLLMHPLRETWLSAPEAAAEEPEPNLAGLLFKLRPQIARGGVPRCGIVHRLDRQTSGALVVAKTPQAYERLTAAFAERRAAKIYRAIVLGELRPEGAQVEAPVGRRPGRRRMEVLPWGREAKTSFKVVDSGRGVALVEAAPLTGRTHQIRVHLAELGIPVLGDPEWIRKPELAKLQRLGCPEAPRLMLHAYRLALPHPVTGKPLRFTAPLPADFKDYWKRLKAGASLSGKPSSF